MHRRSIGIIILTILGIITSLFQLGFGILSQDGFSLIVGIFYLILCIALSSLQNWVRVVFISCSLIFLLLEYVRILVATFTIDPFYGMGVLFYLPTALFAFCSIVYLRRNRVKKQFNGYSEFSSGHTHREYVIFWRTYFCFLVFLLFGSVVYSSISKPFQWVDIMITIIALVGLFSFAWQKDLKTILFWKIFSLAYPIWNIYYEFFLQPIWPDEAGRWGIFSLFMVHALAFVKILPLMIVLYLYAFKKHRKKVYENRSIF